ncbi:uncharacterized protein PAC_04526 [Phialocephala subalpina]|uniref:Uncharacterized protein n=1 Tax=Phialocephala subalpina TaxID=576137 RepID=A0A1L7WPG6_9HELO|nr:uncharacterized protein PAC_04526 [Phialocephala subalpina]
MAPYLSVWPTMERIRSQRKIHRDVFDRIADEIGQLLDNHPELEYMSEDQKQCFWEFHTWIGVFPESLVFPGSLDPLHLLVQQNKSREQAANDIPHEEQDAGQDGRWMDQFYVPVQQSRSWEGARNSMPHPNHGLITQAPERNITPPGLTTFVPQRRGSAVQNREQTSISLELYTTTRQQQDSVGQGQEHASTPINKNTGQHHRQELANHDREQTSTTLEPNARIDTPSPPKDQALPLDPIQAFNSPSKSRIQVIIPLKTASETLQFAPRPMNQAPASSRTKITTSQRHTLSTTPDTSIESYTLDQQNRRERERSSRSFTASSLPPLPAKRARESLSLESEIEIIETNNYRPIYPIIQDYSTLPVTEFIKPEVQAQLAESTRQVKEWQKQILGRYGPDELVRVSKGTKVDSSAVVSLLSDFRMWLYINKKEGVSTFEGARMELYTKDSALVKEWLLKTSLPDFTRTFGGSCQRDRLFLPVSSCCSLATAGVAEDQDEAIRLEENGLQESPELGSYEAAEDV